ncbi:NAD(P)-dependent oxidoreductase [Mycobacterium sp. RTGN6]|nr:NAD(P)-dependent oxidoreductase [Mycobacterium sp. RTGN6]
MTTVGFVGVGRLGLPLACSLLDAGFTVVCTNRGNAELLVARGATVPGDGSVSAVAEAADIIASCLPSVASFDAVTAELLTVDDVPPLIEMSTLPVSEKERVRKQFIERGSELFDAPVSGTPPMAQAKIAMIYASGDRAIHDRFKDVFAAMSPNYCFVGEFGTGTKMKLVAQFLGLVHVTAAAQAMAYAHLAGLDLHQVAELISASPGAMSGQFKIRAPLIASGEFEGRLVTVDLSLKDVDEVIAYGQAINAPVDLISIVGEHFHKLADDGYGASDPASLFQAFIR